jgi:hypothetical protein
MPYRNPTNESVASRVRAIDQNHINRINTISETNAYDIPTPLESMTLHHNKVVGGSGFAAATAQDLGFEPTLGASPATGSGMSAGGMSAGGMSAGGVSAGGMSGAGVSGGGIATSGMQLPTVPSPAELRAARSAQRSRIKAPPNQTDNLAGGALLTLQDLDKMSGQPPPGRRVYRSPQAGIGEVRGTPPPQPGAETGGAMPARRANARNQLVREIMAKHKLSLPQASKYIKEHNLHTKQ